MNALEIFPLGKSGQVGWELQRSLAPPGEVLALDRHSQTRLDGETLIAARYDKYVVLRTSWVYAARGSDFAKTMLRLGRERERSPAPARRPHNPRPNTAKLQSAFGVSAGCRPTAFRNPLTLPLTTQWHP